MSKASTLRFLADTLRKSGFTLVELIVVITILAILALIGFLSLSGYSKDAQDSANRTIVRAVYSAISLESTKNGDSPRKYIVYQSGASLSGASFSGTYLIPGPYGSGGTNYTAGTPDWAALRIDPSKFQVAYSEGSFVIPAAYAASSPLVGAVDLSQTLASGKTRTLSFYQVVGVSSTTSKSYVEGNYPTTLSGSTAGLVADTSGNAVTDSSSGSIISGGSGGGGGGGTCTFDSGTFDNCTFG